MNIQYFYRILIITFIISFPLTGIAETQNIVVEGRSTAKDKGRAYDEALNDAFREAVNQAAGVLVTADTLTKNYRMVADRVFSKSRGYIKSYKVLSKGEDEDGFYIVKIRADVLMDPLSHDLEAIGLLKQVTGGQRIIVIGFEKVEGVTVQSNFVQQSLESALLEKGFDIVDLDQSEQIAARDVALNFDDYSQAVKFGKKYNAEILVSYKALASYAGPEEIYEMQFHRYNVDMTARIIKVDTGRLRTSVADRTSGGSSARGSAANLAFQSCGKEIAPKVVKGVIDTLAREFQGEGADLDINITNIDFKSMTAVKKALGKIRGVNSVGSPKFSGGTAFFRIKANMQAQELAEKLIEVEGMENLEITTIEQNRVDAEWK